MQGAALLDNISYFLRREEKSIVLLLSSARRKKHCSLTFFGAKKEAKKHPPNPSPSLYGRGVTDSGGKPPYVRGLVWLSGFRPTGSP